MFGSPQQLDECSTNEILVCDNNIELQHCIGYLGVLQDDTLDFKDRTNRKCQTAMLNYFKIVRKYLTREATEVLCLSLVISHLDYCNVILYGISQIRTYSEYGVKLVLNRSWYDISKQSLYDIHWHPISTRIHFKILTYTPLSL